MPLNYILKWEERRTIKNLKKSCPIKIGSTASILIIYCWIFFFTNHTTLLSDQCLLQKISDIQSKYYKYCYSSYIFIYLGPWAIDYTYIIIYYTSDLWEYFNCLRDDGYMFGKLKTMKSYTGWHNSTHVI